MAECLNSWSRTGEESLIPLLLIRSVFLGIFLGAFDIAAHSIFLSVFDEKMMPGLMLCQGLQALFSHSFFHGFSQKPGSAVFQLLPWHLYQQ